MDSETKKIVSSIKKDYEAALKRESYLRSAFEKQKKDVLDLNSSSVQYQILKREADTNKELYNGLLQRLKETGISASLTSSNIQILDRAEVLIALFAAKGPQHTTFTDNRPLWRIGWHSLRNTSTIPSKPGGHRKEDTDAFSRACAALQEAGEQQEPSG